MPHRLHDALALVRQSLLSLYRLAIGGTAVGTGINASPDFGEKVEPRSPSSQVTHSLLHQTNSQAQGSLDAMAVASAALRALAVALMKIANDLRWLGSGPRAGLHELILPSNEPGSSIMPGKVNPTQEEVMVMVAIQVIGEDNSVAFAASQGNFESNAMWPIIINNVLHSARILGDACVKLREYSIEGIKLDQNRIDKFVGESLMLVTALSPIIGYDKASAIAHRALDQNTTLREAALSGGFISVEEFDKVMDPKKMVGNQRRDLGMLDSDSR